MKQCSKCGETKPNTEFYRRKDSKDGLHNQCKKCIYLGVKKYRNTERGMLVKHLSGVKYRKNNSEKAKESARLSTAKWRNNNLEKSQEINRLSMSKRRNENPEAFKISDTKNRHKRRALKHKNGRYTITKKFLLKLYS